jgi:myo-inositol-1-phosphate synthase
MKKINIAIAGIGNCASALLQGIEYYKNSSGELIGLMHQDIGGYKIKHIKLVAAFDIDRRKVGKDASEAILEKPNCTTIFQTVPYQDVEIKMGPVLDGFSTHLQSYPEEKRFSIARKKPVDVAKELLDSGADILLNYVPVGSEKAARFYAEEALKAECGYINCMPVFIASDQKWADRFARKRVPLVGDDIKSQIGSTIVHRVLTKLFSDRGVKVDRTYQLNAGGNTDFLNMLNHERLKSKKISKTMAVQSQLEEPLPDENIHIGPSDYVPWLNDRKIAFIRMEGRIFGNIPMDLELRLSVEDSPNSAGSAIDAIRCCKLAQDRGIGGVLEAVSAYTMKHPPVQYTDDEAKRLVEEFISSPTYPTSLLERGETAAK